MSNHTASCTHDTYKAGLDTLDVYSITWFHASYHTSFAYQNSYRVAYLSARLTCASPGLEQEIRLRRNADGPWLDALLGHRAANLTGGAGGLLCWVAERSSLDWSEAVLGVRAAVTRCRANSRRRARRADVDAHFREGAASLAGGALDGGGACGRRVDRSQAVLRVWATVARRRADRCLKGYHGQYSGAPAQDTERVGSITSRNILYHHLTRA
eukprot:COSAG02_NODE_1701_length_11248_cov_8.135348_2_plen_213_part_00